MEHQLKLLAEAITHHEARALVKAHVKEIEQTGKHLVVYVENAGPLHELSKPENDEALRKGLEKLYGEDLTYEVKVYKPDVMGDREKEFGKLPPFKGRSTH